MYVTKVEISNVRGFRDDDGKVNLSLARPSGTPAGWTVIAGRNGTGKTTFLRAIALALAGPSAARALQESFSGWIRNGSNDATVLLDVAFDETFDRFERIGRRPKVQFTVGLKWTRLAGPEPALEQYSLAKTMRQTPSRGPWSEEPRGWFVAGYGPFRRLTGHASDAQRLMVGPNHLPRLVSLFREDASMLECIQWLKDLHLRSLERRPGAEDLKKITLALLNDDMLPDQMKVIEVDSDGLWVEQAGARLLLSDLSDGYRTMIALVLDILRHMHACYGSVDIKKDTEGNIFVNLPGIVMIDEIDVHLHVSWQQRVGFWLKKKFPRIQFLVSSHSPFVCQAADPQGLIRLPAPQEHRTAEHVSADLHMKIVRGTADDAVLSELFGLESTRSNETNELISQLSRLEAQVLKGNISPSDRKKYEKLQMELPLNASSAVQKVLQSLSEPRKTYEKN